MATTPMAPIAKKKAFAHNTSAQGRSQRILGILVHSVLVAVMLFYAYSVFRYGWKNMTHTIAFLIPIAAALYYIAYKGLLRLYNIHPYWVMAAIFVVSALLYTTWNLYADTPALSDYRVLVGGANAVLEGTFPSLSFDKTNYFYFYNYQTGYVLYLALLLRVFGGGLVTLKCFEIIAMALTNVMLFVIARRLYSVRSALISVLLYATLLFNIAGSSIINNQHVSLLLIMLALYCIIRGGGFAYAGTAGVLLAFAVIIRPSAQVVLLACIGYAVIFVLPAAKGQLKHHLLYLGVFAAAYFGVLFVFNGILKAIQFVPLSATGSNLTYFKIILGIVGRSLYGFETVSAEQTQVYFDLQAVGFDYDAYNLQCKEYVINQFKNHMPEISRFITQKMFYFCGAIDNQIDFAGQKIAGTRVQRFMLYAGYEQYTALVALCCCYCATKIKHIRKAVPRADGANHEALLAIIIILYFVAHLFIEVQTRYRYEQYIFFCLIAAPVLQTFYKYCRRVIADACRAAQI